jgi:hypothetical protein
VERLAPENVNMIIGIARAFLDYQNGVLDK